MKGKLQVAAPDSTTLYCIYRIVCFPTGKCYVGQTIDVKRRKIRHFSELRNNEHPNYNLQKEFILYGEESFYFEVLEKKVERTLISDRELYWIMYFHQTASVYNIQIISRSYNRKGVSCIWNGIAYPSLKAAARSIGITSDNLRKRLDKGYTRDSDMVGKYSRGNHCIWNAIEYRSVGEAARANGINRSTMQERLDNGYICDNDLTPKGKSCTWNNIVYKSIKDAADASGVGLPAMHYRIKNGYTCDDDLNRGY